MGLAEILNIRILNRPHNRHYSSNIHENDRNTIPAKLRAKRNNTSIRANWIRVIMGFQRLEKSMATSLHNHKRTTNIPILNHMIPPSSKS